MSKQKPAAATKIAQLKRPPPKVRKQPASAVATPNGSLYSVHPGVAMAQKWIVDLPLKTGRTLEQWIAHIRTNGPDTEQEARDWLKAAHKLGTNTAWWLAQKAFGNPLGLADDSPQSYLTSAPIYVEQMYAGPKADLRPIHDALIRLAQSLGDEVRICPCKTIVPLYRQRVFAEIKPATNKQIDLGFALGGEPFTTRLLDTGGRVKQNRITHRVALATVADLDLQVKRWLREAYERDA